MLTYMENHILTPPQPYYHLPTPESMSVVERVAFEMAQEGHDGRYRHKVEGDIPEIHHLGLTRNILAAADIDNPMTRAAAWMHDLLEDCKKYKSLPPELDDVSKRTLDKDSYQRLKLLYGKATLREEYAGRLIAAGMDRLDAHSTAELVSETVYLLSNHLVAPSSKAEQQADKISSYSDRARVVKIADQLSSMIEDIHYTSQDKTPEELVRYFHKAVSVINECTGHNTVLDKVAEEVIRSRCAQIMQPTLQRKLCDQFDFIELAKGVTKAKRDTTESPHEHWIKMPDAAEKQYGITSLNLDEHGDVVGYRILAYGSSIDKLEGDPALLEIASKRSAVSNHLQTSLNLDAPTEALGSQVNIRYRTLDDGRFCRSYILKTPVDAEDFMGYCYIADALDKDKCHALRAEMKRIKYDSIARKSTGTGGWAILD